MGNKVIAGGGGSGTVSVGGGGSLTINQIPKASAATALVDSSLSDTGSILATSDPQFNIGPQDTVSNGIIGLKGKTSGTATVTAPAIAGTPSNPLLFSNQLSFPTGMGAISQIVGPTDQATQIGSAGLVNIVAASGQDTQFFNGATLDVTISHTVGVRLPSDHTLTWGDVEISRINATDMGVGSNGIQGDMTGNVRAAAFKAGGVTTYGTKVTPYNNIATVSNGVPAEYATIDSTGLTANVAASTLYAVPAAGVGMYRVSAYVVETTAGSLSSTLPNVQIVYNDRDTAGSITIDATPILGIAGIGQTGALTANTIGTASSGVIVISVTANTTIQYQTVNYASNLAGMAYALHIKLEAL